MALFPCHLAVDDIKVDFGVGGSTDFFADLLANCYRAVRTDFHWMEIGTGE